MNFYINPFVYLLCGLADKNTCLVWTKMLLCSLLLWNLALLASAISEAPIVQTLAGQVSGIVQQSFSGNKYLSYLGIPYAENPTGNLRFQAPLEKQSWEGVHDGSKNRLPCLQMLQWNEPQVVGTEDCLWLNVYTPQNALQNGKLLPVLVWIPGGRFLIGTASSQLYSPDFMMDHDLVIVAINYRVGPYGFLSTGDSAATGNYGLLDQVQGLKWIQKNIARFGGDPEKVTISGHSAGSAATHLHMISPLSKGLFSQSISLSGSAANYWAGRATSHSRYAKEMGDIFHCPTQDTIKLMDCLKKVDPVELTQAQWKTHDMFHKTPAKLPLATFLPRIDSEAEHPFMPESPLDLLRQGKVLNLPWMTGLTSQEGAWFISAFYGQDSMEYLKEFDRQPGKAMQSLGIGFFDSDESLALKALNFYTKGQGVADQKQRIAMAELSSDLIFNVECLLAVHIHSRKSSAPVFMYKFNYRGNWTFAHKFEETPHDYEGVAHLDDIGFYLKLPLYHPHLNPEEVSVMKHFTGYIANFVIHGQPDDGKTWLPFQPGNGHYMKIENPPEMSKQVPFPAERLEFWMKEVLKFDEDLMADYIHDVAKDEL